MASLNGNRCAMPSWSESYFAFGRSNDCRWGCDEICDETSYCAEGEDCTDCGNCDIALESDPNVAPTGTPVSSDIDSIRAAIGNISMRYKAEFCERGTDCTDCHECDDQWANDSCKNNGNGFCGDLQSEYYSLRYTYCSGAVAGAIFSLSLIWVLVRNAGDDGDEVSGKLKDVWAIGIFSYRFYDLLMDVGLYLFLEPRPVFDKLMEDHQSAGGNAAIRPIILASAVFGWLLLIPEIFVAARKDSRLGNLFGRWCCWWRPGKNVTVTVIVMCMLLETVPQLYCALVLTFVRKSAYDKDVYFPVIKAALSAVSIVAELYFLFTVFLGKMCCPCIAACDASDRFADNAAGNARGPDANKTDDTTASVVHNPAFVQQ